MAKSRVSLSALRSPLASLSPAGFILALPTGALAPEEMDKLCGLLLRSGDLFSKTPNLARQSRRDAFAADIVAHVTTTTGQTEGQRLAAVFTVHREIEAAYHSLGGHLAALPVRSRSPEDQAAIALALIAVRSEGLHTEADAALARMTALNLGNEIRGLDSDGQPYSIDGVTGALLSGLRITLTMLAYEGHWFDKAGVAVFPASLDLQAAQPQDGHGCEIMAAFWRRWERVEERRRFWGGDWTLTSGPTDPRTAKEGEASAPPPGPSEVLQYHATEEEVLDWIANERAKEVAIQSFAKTILASFGAGPCRSPAPGSPVPLAPLAALRAPEIVGAGYLATVLGQNIFQDVRRFAGLRLVEWLRGYAALGFFAEEALSARTGVDRWVVRFAPGDLEARLGTVGLDLATAEAFVAHASLHKRSGDLFDTPLVRLDDGGFFLISAASFNADPGKTTLSRLNAMGAAPQDKGTVFEQAVHDLFVAQGLKPFTIDTTRDGEDYELDVLVPWGDRLFVFECKNRGLSDGNPMAGYCFGEQLDDFVSQIERQIGGLRRHPDMALAAGGIDIADYTIVPCILFSEPFALPEGRDGVKICDWSSLTRFFQERHVFRLHPYELAPNQRAVHRVALYDQWGATAPTATSLTDSLDKAVQVQVMLSRLDPRDETFPLSNTRIVHAVEFSKGDENLDELSTVLGFDPNWVRAEAKRGVAEVKKIRKALKTTKPPSKSKRKR